MYLPSFVLRFNFFKLLKTKQDKTKMKTRAFRVFVCISSKISCRATERCVAPCRVGTLVKNERPLFLMRSHPEILFLCPPTQKRKIGRENCVYLRNVGVLNRQKIVVV